MAVASTYPLGTPGWALGVDAAGSVRRFPVRDTLTAARTYFVRADGSDANDGRTDTATGAFLTIAKALQVVAAIDIAGYSVTVQLGANTWTVPVNLPVIVGGTAVLRGDPTTPANVHINVTGNGITSTTVGWTVNGVKVSATVFGVIASGNGVLSISNIDVGTCGNFQVYAASGSRINFNTSYTISGGGLAHWATYDSGSIVCQQQTINTINTPAISNFAVAGRAATLAVNANTFTGTGTTGNKYLSTSNGVIDVGGAGINYLPGSTAGSTSGGIYV